MNKQDKAKGRESRQREPFNVCFIAKSQVEYVCCKPLLKRANSLSRPDILSETVPEPEAMNAKSCLTTLARVLETSGMPVF